MNSTATTSFGYESCDNSPLAKTMRGQSSVFHPECPGDLFARVCSRERRNRLRFVDGRNRSILLPYSSRRGDTGRRCASTTVSSCTGSTGYGRQTCDCCARVSSKLSVARVKYRNLPWQFILVVSTCSPGADQ